MSPATSQTKPKNVLLILLDDYGWKDAACYGSSFYETPHIDALASQGMRFTNAYASCPVCSPTRASMLTGKYPARLGVTNWISHQPGVHPNTGKLVDAPYVKQLDTNEYSLARCLKDNGYQTWHVGKWHLGLDTHWPDKHGFDVNIGGADNGSPPKGYFSPYGLKTLADGPEGEYLTDRLTDEAIGLIENASKDANKGVSGGALDDRPFFLNYWPYAVHTPIQAKEKDIAYFEKKAKRLKLDQVNPIVTGEHFPVDHKKHLHVERRIIQSNPVYAAMIKNMDENLGRLFACLKEQGKLDDTLIIFTSDNGGLATAETSPTCNAPLAEGKGWMYEGGTREPLIMSLPGVIQKGSVCDDITTTPDIYPTILQTLGLPMQPSQHCDGVSLYPLFKGKDNQSSADNADNVDSTGSTEDSSAQAAFERGPIFWHYPHYGNQGGTPGCSVRLGDYKLIEFFQDSKLELYNLAADISETKNLADELPKVRDDLHAQLVKWRTSIEAKIPLPNPDYESV